MRFRGPFQCTVFCDSYSKPTPFFGSFSCLNTKSFFCYMHEALIGVCTHILLKGYIHSTAIRVQIFPACNLFSPAPQKCLKYLPEITQWFAFSFLMYFHFAQSTHQQLRQRSTFSQRSVLLSTLCTMSSPSGLLFILSQGNTQVPHCSI